MDKAEFERLYAVCESQVKRYAYYRLPSKADGDDVLQEALLAAYRSRELCRNAEVFKAWLLRILVNKCNDFYRERAKQSELSLDEIAETQSAQNRFGLTTAETVKETLETLDKRDKQILRLFYIEDMPQSEIAARLGIPVGTVKSRIYTAKQRFKNAYPFTPHKGGANMKKLPEIMPEYKIEKSNEPSFPVKWEELMGWFIVPRIGEKLSWAMYDMPERSMTGQYDMEATGQAFVHGIKGVKICAKQSFGKSDPGKNSDMYFIAQLTETHSRFLAESHYSKDRDAMMYFTFLDGDTIFEDIGSFIGNWGFGEDNCGNEIHIQPKGKITRDGDKITHADSRWLLDAVGRYTVKMDGKTYDTMLVIDIETYGVMTETYLDRNGRTVLWRRFNRNDWNYDHYKRLWSDKLPDNERLSVNGETYVHWYDCITDYIL